MIINISEKNPVGWESFLKSIEDLPIQAQRKILRPGVAAMARDFKKVAVAAAPVGDHPPIKSKNRDARGPGHLKKSIYTQSKQFKDGPRAWVKVGAYYARFLEWGTKQRKIKGSRYRGANRGKIDATRWLSKALDRADPDRMLERQLTFMQRALERMIARGK